VLHDESDHRVFDSIIVISDRRVIDRQLQDVVKQFEQTLGVVETIGERKTSRDLKKALEQGKTIIVSTLQKFPIIVNEIESLTGTRFAVIIDEAHSSQTGESAKSLKAALSVGSMEDAEEIDAGEPPDYEDQIVAEMQSRQCLPTLVVLLSQQHPKRKRWSYLAPVTMMGTLSHLVCIPCAKPLKRNSSSMC
jgi:type I restriction enzyme R subunit